MSSKGNFRFSRFSSFQLFQYFEVVLRSQNQKNKKILGHLVPGGVGGGARIAPSP